MAKYQSCTPALYSGDGSRTQFTIPWPYQDKSHIVVELWDDNIKEWIKVQNNTLGYTFSNSYTIQFHEAPQSSTAVSNVRITRKTAINIMAEKFETDRVNCKAVTSGASKCVDDEEGWSEPPTEDDDTTPADPSVPDSGPVYGTIENPDDEEPRKVGDTIYYFHPCKQELRFKEASMFQGGYKYDTGNGIIRWYRKHPTSGVVQLIQEDRNYEARKGHFGSWYTKAPDKFLKYKVTEADVGWKIFITVQCSGCGPEKDGLCAHQFGGMTKHVIHQAGTSDAAVTEEMQGQEKRMIPVGAGWGQIEVKFNSGVIADKLLLGGCISHDTGSITTDTQTGVTYVFDKINEKHFVTTQVLPSMETNVNWEYTVSFTRGIDTSKYKYARWVGKKITHIGAYSETINDVEKLWDPTHTEVDYTSPWIDYSNTGYLSLQGMQECNNQGNLIETAGNNPEAIRDPTWHGDYDIFGLMQSVTTTAIRWRSKVWAIPWGEFDPINFNELTIGGIGLNGPGSACSGNYKEPFIKLPKCPERYKKNHSIFVKNNESFSSWGDRSNNPYRVGFSTYNYKDTSHSWFALDGYWEFSNDEGDTKEVHNRWEGVGYTDWAVWFNENEDVIGFTNRDEEAFLDWHSEYLELARKGALRPWWLQEETDWNWREDTIF